MFKYFYIILFSFALSQYAPYFDGDLAYDYLLKQCSFGPRYPGSKAHLDFKDFLVKYLKDILKITIMM